MQEIIAVDYIIVNILQINCVFLFFFQEKKDFFELEGSYVCIGMYWHFHSNSIVITHYIKT